MQYDFVFSGSGLSTLVVLYEMLQRGDFEDCSILVIEPEVKRYRDRTWCFWEKGTGEWDFVVQKQWQTALFSTEKISVNCLPGDLRYKMIPSDVFYEEVVRRLQSWKSVVWVQEKTLHWEEKSDHVVVQTDHNLYQANYFFNSVAPSKEVIKNSNYPLLQQHFVGWFVRFEKPLLNADIANFMDFSVAQNGNTRFLYVLPTSAKEALLEYTLFSAEELVLSEYETAITEYLKQKGMDTFEIIEKERGNIPMTVYPFWKKNSKRVLHIGTAGGWTKASTGFTFKNTTKKAKRLVSFLKSEEIDFSKFHKTNRFLFYDALFVSVLYSNNVLGKTIFSAMFQKVRADKILRFLEEESTIIEELEIIMACPKLPFLKALWKFIFTKKQE